MDSSAIPPESAPSNGSAYDLPDEPTTLLASDPDTTCIIDPTVAALNLTARVSASDPLPSTSSTEAEKRYKPAYTLLDCDLERAGRSPAAPAPR